MLAQQGYLVASVDNRGTSAPRGRDWRRSVHRQIGILATHEQAAAVRAMLQRWPEADAGRVGVWGWSGGGSMSLNAIFRYPDLYSTAIAVAPNANQLLYDTIYQERYMGLPGDNAEGYRDGSPLTHAQHLRGNLLLVHGTGDDNGHYQGTEMLMNELIARDKPFTVMPYPNRSHSISEGTNTVRHFYGTLTRYLHEHLPTGARRDRDRTMERMNDEGCSADFLCGGPHRVGSRPSAIRRRVGAREPGTVRGRRTRERAGLHLLSPQRTAGVSRNRDRTCPPSERGPTEHICGGSSRRPRA